MNLKKVLKIAAVVLGAAVFAPFAVAQDDDFREQMSDYSKTQKILEAFEKNKITLVLKVGKSKKFEFDWIDDINKLYNSARMKRINEKRVPVIARIQIAANEAFQNKFEDFNVRIDEILRLADYGDQEVILLMTVSLQLERFLLYLGKIESPSIDKREIRDALAILKVDYQNNKLLEKVQARFEDTQLQSLVDDYVALFPDMNDKLRFHKGKSSINSFEECCKLLNFCMKAYWKLDEHSAVADFRIWGRHMLNYLLLDSNPVMIDEFNRQMENYKRVFKAAAPAGSN